MSSDPALLSAELQPSQPPSSQGRGNELSPQCPAARPRRPGAARVPWPHTRNGKMGEGEGTTKPDLTKNRYYFLCFPARQVSFGGKDGAGSVEWIWDWGTVG